MTKSSNQFDDFCENPEKLTENVKTFFVFSQNEKNDNDPARDKESGREL
jgi:hypothetical protein